MSNVQGLREIANQLRIDVLQMVVAAGAGHVAGPLSSADIISALYFGETVDLKRDKIILSCGHYCPVQYAALARAGLFPVEELATFMQIEGRLPGHPERGKTPGIEVSAGPLGQGISVAVGMAMGMKISNPKFSNSQIKDPTIYCVLSDGELQEGQVWEAFNLAVRRQLDNLIFILDRNRVQIENYVSQVATYGNVAGRLEAFGLNVREIDGNKIEEVVKAIKWSSSTVGGPKMIVANTIASRGVSFMENKPEWHDRVPTKDELVKALRELGTEEVI